MNNDQPLLNIRPPTPVVTKEIDWDRVVSYGQFGCVWKADYEGNEVAIKIIQAHEKSTWNTEKTIYELGLNHENILKFFCAEKRLSDSNLSQYCIITQYHAKGSLADFLSSNTLDWNGMLKLALSLADGLAYLHNFTNTKPVIAHRDLKSRNVLVKDDLECCISDFGSASQLSNLTNRDEIKAQVSCISFLFYFNFIFIAVILLSAKI